MDRLGWQQLAERWLVDAKKLLDEHRWSAAYYLAGYAVECGLKACVVVRVAASPEIIFESKQFSANCWTHDIMDLKEKGGRNLFREKEQTRGQQVNASSFSRFDLPAVLLLGPGFADLRSSLVQTAPVRARQLDVFGQCGRRLFFWRPGIR